MIIIKRCLILTGFVLFFTSCDHVIFPEPQPKKEKPLKEIPAILQGSYIDHNGDSLLVYSDHFIYTDDGLVNPTNIYLSDSNVLKVYEGHYFYNTVLDLDSGRFWITYMISIWDDRTGFDLLTMDPDDIVKLAKLQEITSKVRDIKDGDSEYYLFDPKRRHYKKIISDSIFTKMMSFRRID